MSLLIRKYKSVSGMMQEERIDDPIKRASGRSQVHPRVYKYLCKRSPQY